jgi:phosphonate transport system ATP-binding protein
MAVELTGVTVRHGDAVALAGVDLVVELGERVALVGSSGAGKTSLLDVVSGLVRPTTGAVRVLDEDLSELKGARLRVHRARVGAVSQHLDMALALRVIHNVNAGRLGRWFSPAALWSLVHPSDRPGAHGVLDQVGLADRLFSRTDSLSGGERQRVAVARVLRQAPDLVLADEPTSSVDPRLADEVMGLLCGPLATAPWTTVVSVHNPDLARRHAGRIVGLREGAVVFDRPAPDVSAGELAALYRTDR